MHPKKQNQKKKKTLPATTINLFPPLTLQQTYRFFSHPFPDNFPSIDQANRPRLKSNKLFSGTKFQDLPGENGE